MLEDLDAGVGGVVLDGDDHGVLGARGLLVSAMAEAATRDTRSAMGVRARELGGMEGSWSGTGRPGKGACGAFCWGSLPSVTHAEQISMRTAISCRALLRPRCTVCPSAENYEKGMSVTLRSFARR